MQNFNDIVRRLDGFDYLKFRQTTCKVVTSDGGDERRVFTASFNAHQHFDLFDSIKETESFIDELNEAIKPIKDKYRKRLAEEISNNINKILDK